MDGVEDIVTVAGFVVGADMAAGVGDTSIVIAIIDAAATDVVIGIDITGATTRAGALN